MIHVVGRLNTDHSNVPWRRFVGPGCDQRNLRSHFFGRTRQGKAHFARRIVGDIAYRIDPFHRASGGNYDFFAPKLAVRFRFPLEKCFHDANDRLRLFHPAFSDIAAGQQPFSRLDELYAPLRQNVQIVKHGGMLVHMHVHRRSDHNGRSSRQQNS
ncbi:hypothetical protein D3C71_1379780 [compost metagenome]